MRARRSQVLDSINFPVLTAFANALHALQPARLPGFAFAWLELASHRMLMPKLLSSKGQRGWVLFQRLLVHLLRFLQPFLQQAQLPEPVRRAPQTVADRRRPRASEQLEASCLCARCGGPAACDRGGGAGRARAPLLALIPRLRFAPRRALRALSSAQVRLLYRGLLRVLLVLLHDFPEFLADYHFALADCIPTTCVQMRNIVLSGARRAARSPRAGRARFPPAGAAAAAAAWGRPRARRRLPGAHSPAPLPRPRAALAWRAAFPRNMRLPDPFTPNLKVDLLAEIAQVRRRGQLPAPAPARRRAARGRSASAAPRPLTPPPPPPAPRRAAAAPALECDARARRGPRPARGY